MKTDKIAVSDLFEKPRRYLVPLFQRGYVWTRDGQWAPLWEDLRELVVSLDAQRKSSDRQVRKHFLGAVVLQQQTAGVRHVPVSDVIDGQQRITTLQVLLIALRNAVADLGNDFLNAPLNRLTQNPGPHVDPAESLKVWPTSIYREDFRALAETKSDSEISAKWPPVYYRRKLQPRPQLVEAYFFFIGEIKKYLSIGITEPLRLPNRAEDGLGTVSVDEMIQRAENLLDAITRHVQLVEINLDAEDDPQIIFETLNARGAPLSPSDLVRNYIFLYATRHQENADELYDTYWRPFDETLDSSLKGKTRHFWREVERQGRLRTNRLDLFLYHYLAYRTEADLKLGHVFQAFKDWWDDAAEPRSAKDELAALAIASEVYRQVILAMPHSRLGRLGAVLRIIDTTTVFPVVFFLESHRSPTSNAEIDGIYDDLESYLVRRMVCGLTPKNYNHVFLTLLKRLQRQEEVTRASVQQYLLSLTGDSAVWPDNDTFGHHFVADALYDRLSSARVQMILEAIERNLGTSFQESVSVDGRLSIEHIWPQNPARNAWPPDPVEDDGSHGAAWFKRQSMINSIGNLTLVTPSFNSSLSNRSFAKKRPALLRESRLRLNVYFQASSIDSWTEENIAERGRELFTHAMDVWAQPERP